MAEAEYQKTPRNTINRYRQQAQYDHKTIHSIVDEATVLYVSFNAARPPSKTNSNEENDDDDEDEIYPTILPMLGCTGSFPPDDHDAPTCIYLHGYASGRLMKHGKPNSTSSGTSSSSSDPSNNDDDDNENDKGAPICVSATLTDGLVLSLSPYSHNLNYRSAVLFGRAHPVTSAAEKLHAMELITDNLVPARWRNTRVPPTKAEFQSTGILRVEIEAASAKVRMGGVVEEKRDLKDVEVRGRVWTGVVPVVQRWLEPVVAVGDLSAGVPGYLEGWRERVNAAAERYAVENAR